MQTERKPIESTQELKAKLFDGDDDRLAFVRDQIVHRNPVNRDPVEEELLQRVGDSTTLGPVRLWHEYDEPLVAAAELFVHADDLETKRETALAWLRGICTQDVAAAVIVYTLTRDGDFATLERLWPDWCPEVISAGDRIRYQGMAYPELGMKGLSVTATGERFVIEEIVPGRFDVWYGIRNLDFNEWLWLTDPLLLNAEFLTAEHEQDAA